jgi:hypothetical protein
MKTLKEYLTESKKVYSFKIKIACDLPEGFDGNFKKALEKYSISRFEKTKTTPVQESPLDFPEVKNASVSMYEVDVEYPIISPQIVTILTADLGCQEAHVRVRGANELDTYDVVDNKDLEKGKALLNTPYEKGAKFKDYFGDAYNKSFLKDLEKASKQRKKDLGQKDVKAGATDAGPDYGQKAASPIGSHQNKLPENE